MQRMPRFAAAASKKGRLKPPFHALPWIACQAAGSNFSATPLMQ